MPVYIDREDRITALLERNNVLLEANLQANLNAIAAWQQQASAFHTFACAMSIQPKWSNGVMRENWRMTTIPSSGTIM